MVSNDSITLGLSSPSTAAIENQLSFSSSSSSRLLSVIVPWVAVALPSALSLAGLNGMVVTGAVCGAGICDGRPGWLGPAMLAIIWPSGPIWGVGRALASGPA